MSHGWSHGVTEPCLCVSLGLVRWGRRLASCVAGAAGCLVGTTREVSDLSHCESGCPEASAARRPTQGSVAVWGQHPRTGEAFAAGWATTGGIEAQCSSMFFSRTCCATTLPLCAPHPHPRANSTTEAHLMRRPRQATLAVAYVSSHPPLYVHPILLTDIDTPRHATLQTQRAT